MSSEVTMMLGGHVIRAGVAPSMTAMMQAGYINHLAMNGAAAIHDFELALIGASIAEASYRDFLIYRSASCRSNAACS